VVLAEWFSLFEAFRLRLKSIIENKESYLYLIVLDFHRLNIVLQDPRKYNITRAIPLHPNYLFVYLFTTVLYDVKGIQSETVSPYYNHLPVDGKVKQK